MVKVKIAEKKDLKEFARLRFEAHKYSAQFDRDVVVSDDTLSRLEELTKKEFEDPRIVYLVARERDRMIGIGILSLAVGVDKSAFLGELFVEEKYRGRGVGRKLLDEVIKVVKNRGFKNLELTVATNNKAAQKLYLELGFKPKKREYLLFQKSL